MNQTTDANRHFTSDDGLSIFYRHRPATPEKARMVLAHGLGEHSGRYRHVIDRIVDTGISVWAIDHRGHGHSEGKRGHVDSIDQYIADLAKMVDIAKSGMPETMTCFLLGHSMGGLMVLNYAEKHPDAVHAVVASSPGLNPGMKVPVVKGGAAKIISRIWPSLSFDNELDSSKISHDPEVVKAYDNDPLVHGRITARWFTEFMSAMAWTRENAGRIKLPVLMQVAGDDRLVDAPTSRRFFESLTVSDKTLLYYDNLYHEIYNERLEDRNIVLNDLVNWLQKHM